MVDLGAAALMGLMGSGHCLGMCGGILGALSIGQVKSNYPVTLMYQLGRISTYALMGLTFAWLASLWPSSPWPWARTLAGILFITLGLYFARIWQGILILEKIGAGIWLIIQPFAKPLIPVNTPFKAYLLGIIWGWLPCGLVYSALGLAAAQNHPIEGAVIMGVFGMGTLPAMLLGGTLMLRIKKWLMLSRVRTTIAWLYILLGVWTLSAAWYHVLMHSHSASHHHSGMHHG